MSIYLIAGIGLLSVAIVVLVMGGFAISEQRRMIARRLTTPNAEGVSEAQLHITLEDGFLKRFNDIVTPGNDAERAKIRTRLVRAGYRKPSAMRIYFLSKAVLAIAFGGAAAVIVPALSLTIPFPVIAMLIVTPALLGNILPPFWIERKIQRRQESAELGFPDTLDMLLVCIEAGLGIDSACRRVSEQIGKTCPVLAEELKAINEELLAGKQRATVFEDFANRLGVNDIKAFTTVLKQSDEFGVSIAETLRVYAAEMRHKRVMKAEEKANLMPVKVALGSIFFTIPPTMLIIAGPSMIMLARAFAKVSGH